MSSSTTDTSSGSEKSMFKELARRRVFVFFWAFVLFAISNTIMEESDIFMHVLDDYVDIALAVIAIVVFIAMWRSTSPQRQRTANNIATVLAVLLALITIFAITQEMGDPADFGNEIPTMFFAIFMIINRFV